MLQKSPDRMIKICCQTRADDILEVNSFVHVGSHVNKLGTFSSLYQATDTAAAFNNAVVITLIPGVELGEDHEAA